MRSNALAFSVPLNSDPHVEAVDDIDSCTILYPEGTDDDIPSDTNIYDLMDVDNHCRSPGGHLWLNGICVHCGDPVPGSRRFSCGAI